MGKRKPSRKTLPDAVTLGEVPVSLVSPDGTLSRVTGPRAGNSSDVVTAPAKQAEGHSSKGLTRKTEGTLLGHGRTGQLDQAMMDYILGEIREGRTLVAVCDDPAEYWPGKRRPSTDTVYFWKQRNPAFAAALSRAREACADRFVTRIVGTTETMTEQSVSVDRERIRSWQWLAKVNNPREYGDAKNVSVTGADGGPVQVSHSLDVDSLPEHTREALRQAIASAKAKIIDHD